MTHFIARFPHIGRLVENPMPCHYFEAGMWYYWHHNQELYDKFMRVYRKLTWSREIAARRIELEGAE